MSKFGLLGIVVLLSACPTPKADITGTAKANNDKTAQGTTPTTARSDEGKTLPGEPVQADSDTRSESDIERELRDLVRANTFASKPGVDTLDEVDWPSVVFATGLSAAQAFTDMSKEELEMLGGAAPAAEKISKALTEPDYEAEGKRASAVYAKLWKGSEGCTSQIKDDPILDKIPPAVESSLTPVLTKRLADIRRGSAFNVTCKAGKGLVVIGRSGKVLAMEVPRPASDDTELFDAAENRFVGYMNQPDEPAEQPSP